MVLSSRTVHMITNLRHSHQQIRVPAPKRQIDRPVYDPGQSKARGPFSQAKCWIVRRGYRVVRGRVAHELLFPGNLVGHDEIAVARAAGDLVVDDDSSIVWEQGLLAGHKHL